MREKTTILLNSVIGLIRSTASGWPARRRDTTSTSRLNDLTAELSRLAGQVQHLTAESAQTKAELERLDRDLDESRRLNLRAAELLDIVYAELSSGPHSEAGNNHRRAPDAGGAGA
jgi:hypothetical protein